VPLWLNEGLADFTAVRADGQRRAGAIGQPIVEHPLAEQVAPGAAGDLLKVDRGSPLYEGDRFDYAESWR
jgi:hypothetical protein